MTIMRRRPLLLPYVLRGRLVLVKADIHPADPSVGIREPFIDCFDVVEIDGATPIAVPPVDAECDAIFEDERLQRMVENEYWREFPDEWHWPDRWVPMMREW